MQVASLMAGVGSRLGGLTADRHKAMLRINGRSILEHQLATFKQTGLTNATFVLGHGAEEITHSLFKNLPDVCFTIKYNAEFTRRNLDWSAYLALSSCEGPVFYYEGDLLVPPSLLLQLSASASDVCLAVDSRIPSSRADTLLTVSGGKPEHLIFCEHGVASGHDAANAAGELICLLKLSERARRTLVELLEQQSFVGDMQLYRLVERTFSTLATDFIDVGNRPWVEVDNIHDLRRAEALIPAILSG